MASTTEGALGDVGEFGFVDDVVSGFGQGPGVVVGPGDDAAVIAAPGGQVVASVDLTVEGADFRRDWSSAADVGHKVAAGSLSDINAMGGRATALLVGFAAPAELSVSWAKELTDGLAAEAEVVGASVVGGDVASAPTITVSVTALGVCEDRIVRRSGAQPGDLVALCGRQGWAEAGLAVLRKGFRSPRAVVEAHRRPDPPYDAGPEAAALGATAMIDISDGLVQDLSHIAAASGVGIDLAESQLQLPEPVHAVGAALGVDPMGFVLGGGEDFGLVATFPAGSTLPDRWRVVGTVSSDGEPGAVTVDGVPHSGRAGHQHFRS